jgi:hypothetical protein
MGSSSQRLNFRYGQALDASLVVFAMASRDEGKCFYNPYAGISFEDMEDAYLYLGPGNSLTRSLPSPDLFNQATDPEWCAASAPMGV